MKTSNKINLIRAVIFFALIYFFAFMLTSCGTTRNNGGPCYANKHYVGYGPGGWRR